MKKITSRKKLALYGCSGMGVNMMNLIVGSYLCSALITGGFAPEAIGRWTYIDKSLVVATPWRGCWTASSTCPSPPSPIG